MDDGNVFGLTVVGGRPDEQSQSVPGISPGFRDLVGRLAQNPSLARDLVADPEGTLGVEGLTLTATELAMLRDLGTEDLEQARVPTRGLTRGGLGESLAKGVDEDTRRLLAAQLELVAPFMADVDFYMGERTRGIRPQSIYPTPFAVAQAFLSTHEEFRVAFLEDPEAAVLAWPDLPLTEAQRRALLTPALVERLSQLARDE
jgi:hypothetical protein